MNRFHSLFKFLSKSNLANILVLSLALFLFCSLGDSSKNEEANKSEVESFELNFLEYGDAPQSIAWDGANVWITIESAENNNIVKIDANNSEVIKTWRATTNSECSGAFRDGYLWTIGQYSPSGAIPPNKNNDHYEVLLKYSTANNDLVLTEKYAFPCRNMGAGNCVTFDPEGNLYVFLGRKIGKLKLHTNVEAPHHPGLTDVWLAEIVDTLNLFSEPWVVKGGCWIDWADGREELIVGGYLYPDMSWNPDFNWETMDMGHFGMAWDSENEVLWQVLACIYKQTREKHASFLDDFFN